MEDPIEFGVWGRVAPSALEEAKRVLARERPGLSRMEVLKSVAKSTTGATPILIAEGVGWGKAQDLRMRLDTAFDGLQILQDGYKPEDEGCMRFCNVHRLFFWGVLGCPVCDGRAAG